MGEELQRTWASLPLSDVRQLDVYKRQVFYFSLVSSVCGSVWLLISDIHPVDLHSGALLLGVATFATAAQLAMTRAYAGSRTLMAAALAYSTVIFASLFGMLIWHETHDLWSWLAVALIVLSGLAATHFSPVTLARRP